LRPQAPHSAEEADEAGDVPQLADLNARIAELERAVVARDDLVALVGHELRNPLSPVFLQAYHLLAEVRKSKTGVVTTEWLLPRLELFLRGLDRLLERLNRLMDVAALQSAQGITLLEEDLDLSRVATDVVASMSSEATAASAQVDLRLPGPVEGRWDRVRLEQIVGNLLSNAIRFGGGSRIVVAVEEIGPDKIRLRVSDHGPGVPEELQPRIFDRFEWGPKRHRGGLGLGLWIVRRLCETMGGAIVLENQEGGGAAFLVTLPRGKSGVEAR